MGQTMSRPATTKTTESGGNDKFSYSVSEMQGWRVSMEDAHTIQLSLDAGQDDSNTFFAVYDGHGGGAAAKYAGQNVHKQLVDNDAYRSKQYHAALKTAFLSTDSNMRNSPEFQHDGSGCTAVAALVTTEGKIYVANAGDSRSVLSVKGEAKPLSFDHKPQNEVEKTRITAAGGYVSFGRVNGNLALARALGDFDYKKNASLSAEAQIITSDPDITEHDITEEDEFIVLACDGIWDCLSSQQVVDVVRLLISQGKQLSQVCEEICELCLAPDTTGGVGIGCDNMTILVVALLHGRSMEEWHNWVAERATSKYGYETPDVLPQIYSDTRMSGFKARREIWEKRDRERDAFQAAEREREARGELPAYYHSLGPLGKMLCQEPGTSYDPSTGVLSLGGQVWEGPTAMIANDDPDENDSDDAEEDQAAWDAPDMDEETEARYHEIKQDNATKSLQAQLDELEKDRGVDEDGDLELGHSDAQQSESDPPPELQGEAPPPPAPKSSDAGGVNGKQLEHLPGGDAPSSAVKAEGLLDSSENPLQV